MDFYCVLWVVLIVGDQGLCFEMGVVEGQWSGFVDVVYVGQGLFDDCLVDVLMIEYFKYQIEVVIVYFLCVDQFRWVVDVGELLCVSYGIVGGEGMVL